MIGNNEIRLNQSTMLEAINFWLESQFMAGKAPLAMRVDQIQDGHVDIFVIKTSEVEDPTEA